MTADEVKARFWEGLGSFLQTETELFEVGAGERVLVATLQGYLEGRFGDLTVDVEYDRHGTDPKYLARYRQLLTEHGLRVAQRDAPRSIDLIVHRRNTDEENLLAVEVKRAKNKEDRTYDRLKLQALMEELEYRLTLFLEFGDGGDVIEEVWTSRG